MSKKLSTEIADGLPTPTKIVSRPRRSDRKARSKYATDTPYMRSKSRDIRTKEKSSRVDPTPYVVELKVSPPAKQKISRLFNSSYPKAIDVSSISKSARKKLIFCGPPVKLSFTDNDGSEQQREVAIYIQPQDIDFLHASRTYTTSATNFSRSKKTPTLKKSAEQVSEVSSVTITDENIQTKEPVRRDRTNFGSRAIDVPQQYLYSDKSIWGSIQKNKDKLRYLVSCQKSFLYELYSNEFTEVAALLKHPDVLKELNIFLSLELETTLKYRITILMLLRAFELCHKQPHHSLTPELLEKEPFRDDTISAPKYINKEQTLYHETYIDELAAEGYKVHSVCQPIMYEAENVSTHMSSRLKHTLTITECGKTLSFEFEYDCRSFSVPMSMKKLPGLLIEHYSQRLGSSTTSTSTPMDIKPSNAELLSQSSCLFTTNPLMKAKDVTSSHDVGIGRSDADSVIGRSVTTRQPM